MALLTALGKGITPTELVTNGDMELNANWDSTGTPTTCERSNEQKHGGTYSWKVVTDASSEGIRQQPLPGTYAVGARFALTFWYYGPNDGIGLVCAIEKYGGDWSTYCSTVVYPTTTWQTATIYGSATQTLQIRVVFVSVAAKTFYLDDVSVIHFAGDGVPIPALAVEGAGSLGAAGTIAAAMLTPLAGAAAQQGTGGVISAALPTPVAAAAATKGEGGFISAALPVPAASGTTSVGGTISAALPVPGASATGTASLSPGLAYLITKEDDSMHSIVGGATSVILTVEIRGTDGLPKTGLAFGSVTASYLREGAGTAATVVSLSAGAAGVWSSGGWVEMDPTNFPGVYQFGVPNAALAAAVRSVAFRFSAAACFPKTVQVRILAVNPDDAVRGGMTGLPNVAAGASGGVPVLSAGLEVAATVALGATAANLADLHTDVGTALANVSDVHTDVGTVLANVANLDGDVGDLHTDVGTVLTNVGDLHTDLGTALANLANLDGDVVTLAAAVDVIDGLVDALSVAVAALEDASPADVTAAVLAGVVDGAKTLQQVLRRVNAYVGGTVAIVNDVGHSHLTYKREDGTTTEMAATVATDGRTVA